MKNKRNCDKKRNPGGQPGNLNAVKHGRYMRRVPPDDSKDPSLLSSSLEEEISMLRKATRRLFELSGEAIDIEQWIKVLGALGLASIRTSRLLKSQKAMGDGEKALEIINAAISEVMKGSNGDEWSHD